MAGPEKELLYVLVDNKTDFAVFEARASSVRAGPCRPRNLAWFGGEVIDAARGINSSTHGDTRAAPDFTTAPDIAAIYTPGIAPLGLTLLYGYDWQS